MKTANYLEIEPQKTAPGVGDVPVEVTMRSLVGHDDPASFTMRVTEVLPSESPPHGLHTHPWEHQFFIVSGQAVLIGEKGEIALRAGDMGFIPPGEPHTFTNRSNKPFLFVDCVSRT